MKSHSLVSGFILAVLTAFTRVHAATIDGQWAAEFDSQVGLQKYVYDFKAEGGKLAG